MAELVTIKDAIKAYRGKPVLRVGHFELHSGERVDIIGANGSGKSTLLRMVAGITACSSGEVRFSPQFRALSTGFVPQQSGIHDELTVRQNAKLLGSIVNPRGGTLADRQDLLEDFELAPYLDRPAAALSDGMKRVTAFLAVWAADPDVIVADEPLAGMDSANSARLEALVGTMADNRTFVQATHAPSGSARRVLVEHGEV